MKNKNDLPVELHDLTKKKLRLVRYVLNKYADLSKITGKDLELFKSEKHELDFNDSTQKFGVYHKEK